MDVPPQFNAHSGKHNQSPPTNGSDLPFQVAKINDPNLAQLRETIKNAMIPMLIKVFELKLAAQQTKTPPSRLNKKSSPSLEAIHEQLTLLSKNLDLLHLWCESSKTQIHKAIKEIEELSKASQTPRMAATSSHKSPHPAIEKSFSEALFHQPIQMESTNPHSLDLSSESPQKEGFTDQERKSWLKIFFDWITESSS